MRRLANENPTAQIALIGILVLLFGFLLYTRVLSSGESSSESSPSPTPTVGGTDAAAPAPGTSDEAVAPESVAPEASSTAPPETAPQGEVPASALEPGKGLPAPVVKAYKANKTVMLLIVRQRGVDDKVLKAWGKALRKHVEERKSPRFAMFVTGAKHIAKYSRITLGVNVSRVPALVVLRQKSVSGDVPEASVLYGYRGIESVFQAFKDSRYDGRKNVPYYPE